MSRLLKSCLIFGTLAALLFASAFADDVVVLTEDNFEKEVGQDRGALVEFYAPWYAKTLHFVLSLGNFHQIKCFGVIN